MRMSSDSEGNEHHPRGIEIKSLNSDNENKNISRKYENDGHK